MRHSHKPDGYIRVSVDVEAIKDNIRPYKRLLIFFIVGIIATTVCGSMLFPTLTATVTVAFFEAISMFAIAIAMSLILIFGAIALIFLIAFLASI